MQLAIDIAAETPHALRLAANFLLDHALHREELERGIQTPPPPPAPVDHVTALVPSPPPPPPSVPPVPPAPTPADRADAAAMAFTPPVPAASPIQASIAPDDYDISGIPWDVRIHQVKRGKKKDGTWKLQKGIDPTLVSGVMQELSVRIRPTAPPVVAHTPETVGAPSAPVSLPGAGYQSGGSPSGVPASTIPIPPPPAFFNPAAPQSGGEEIAQSVAASPAASFQPQNKETLAAPQVSVADPFRLLVSKITKARTAQKITAEEVTQCVAAVGAPSLQLLNNMPHLIPAFEASIDAILAVR